MTGPQAGASDAELIEFAAKGRMTVFPANQALLRLGDMEQLYELRQRDTRFELSRQQRSAPPLLLVSSTSLDVVRRYLLRSLGVTVRAELRLPRVTLPFDPAALPDGFAIADARDTDTDANGIELTWTEHGEAITARFRPGSAGERDAVQFAGYADASERAIIESLLAPSGRPLFATA